MSIPIPKFKLGDIVIDNRIHKHDSYSIIGMGYDSSMGMWAYVINKPHADIVLDWLFAKCEAVSYAPELSKDTQNFFSCYEPWLSIANKDMNSVKSDATEEERGGLNYL